MKEYIERAVTLQAIDSNISHLRVVAGESALLNRAVDLVQYTRDFIANVPAADVVERKRGEWGKVYRSKVTVNDGYVSTCCDMWNERKSNFCPNCGADMRGDA